METKKTVDPYDVAKWLVKYVTVLKRYSFARGLGLSDTDYHTFIQCYDVKTTDSVYWFTQLLNTRRAKGRLPIEAVYKALGDNKGIIRVLKNQFGENVYVSDRKSQSHKTTVDDKSDPQEDVQEGENESGVGITKAQDTTIAGFEDDNVNYTDDDDHSLSLNSDDKKADTEAETEIFLDTTEGKRVVPSGIRWFDLVYSMFIMIVFVLGCIFLVILAKPSGPPPLTISNKIETQFLSQSSYITTTPPIQNNNCTELTTNSTFPLDDKNAFLIPTCKSQSSSSSVPSSQYANATTIVKGRQDEAVWNFCKNHNVSLVIAYAINTLPDIKCPEVVRKLEFDDKIDASLSGALVLQLACQFCNLVQITINGNIDVDDDSKASTKIAVVPSVKGIKFRNWTNGTFSLPIFLMTHFKFPNLEELSLFCVNPSDKHIANSVDSFFCSRVPFPRVVCKNSDNCESWGFKAKGVLSSIKTGLSECIT